MSRRMRRRRSFASKAEKSAKLLAFLRDAPFDVTPIPAIVSDAQRVRLTT